MHALLSHQRRYGINVLGADDEWLSRYFSGHPDRAAEPSFREHAAVPLLAGAVAHFVCSVTQTLDVHDHTLFIASVQEWSASPHAALLFYRSRCHPCHGIASEEASS